ncbi:TIGR03750 family conjugal transfer protein [Gilliamella sp. B2776]|uniref:TIGR03750 family conjugal transfer protein n=2 Tax=unclassified Gilliamella TaxID=2685620 RepID=UPI00226ABED5|nr:MULTISPECIES: TIGR03750 family conjugal transfer protein [unclassified Gilliamella]MCX8649586.1 TIGR03750 family conjugal transfer protein [Gilliamella sp. B2779]MCX8691424.1 TIGR03750 family conjugal transfer protein [Gilliamella sp. B2776]MCX8727146.1 TIGR03750 family conjugal transfer protein [Gilliamella sp. B2838]MCX8729276.1 TIGR03750 family conjugal transfer protein [Gilliamella sp. B2969]
MKDNDIKMLPDRLNRMPVVYKGMTVRELLLMIGVGTIIGSLLGIILFILFGRWVLIPSAIVFMPLPTLFFGGNKIAKLKRGKPETWFSRSIDLFFAKKGFNGNNLIFNDEQFIVRRKKRKYNKVKQK